MMRATRLRAFTSVELLVVLSMMSLVAGMAASGVIDAQRRAAVNNAVAAIEQAVSHARVLARGSSGSDRANHEVVISGAEADKGVRVERDGELLFEQRFGPQVHLFIDGTHASASRRIAFANGTGFTSDSTASRGQRISLGRDEDLVLATPDQRIAVRFTIYEVGLLSAVELTR